MIIQHIAGATRVLGKQQGYLGLPVRDEVRDVKIGDQVARAQSMTTAWEPTPDELRRLNEGASVYLCVLGTMHPPVTIEVGEVPA
jgi:hypothetical protein